MVKKKNIINHKILVMNTKSEMIEALVKKNMKKSDSDIPCIFGCMTLCLRVCFNVTEE